MFYSNKLLVNDCAVSEKNKMPIQTYLNCFGRMMFYQEIMAKILC